MNDCISCLFQFGYRVIFPSLILFYSINKWDNGDVCCQRKEVVLIIICLIGPHKCIALIRAYMQEPALEFEITALIWMVYTANYIDKEVCQQNELNFQTNLFQSTIDLSFLIILICNTINYILFMIVLLVVSTIILIQRRYFPNQDDQDTHNNRFLPQPKGLTEEDFSQLKKFIAPQEILENEDIQCSICWDVFKFNHSVIELPQCKHLFHEECIREWFKIQEICPNDRNNIKKALGQQEPQIGNPQINPNDESYFQLENEQIYL